MPILQHSNDEPLVLLFNGDQADLELLQGGLEEQFSFEHGKGTDATSKVFGQKKVLTLPCTPVSNAAGIAFKNCVVAHCKNSDSNYIITHLLLGAGSVAGGLAASGAGGIVASPSSALRTSSTGSQANVVSGAFTPGGTLKSSSGIMRPRANPQGRCKLLVAVNHRFHDLHSFGTLVSSALDMSAKSEIDLATVLDTEAAGADATSDVLACERLSLSAGPRPDISTITFYTGEGAGQNAAAIVAAARGGAAAAKSFRQAQLPRASFGILSDKDLALLKKKHGLSAAEAGFALAAIAFAATPTKSSDEGNHTDEKPSAVSAYIVRRPDAAAVFTQQSSKQKQPTLTRNAEAIAAPFSIDYDGDDVSAVIAAVREQSAVAAAAGTKSDTEALTKTFTERFEAGHLETPQATPRGTGRKPGDVPSSLLLNSECSMLSTAAAPLLRLESWLDMPSLVSDKATPTTPTVVMASTAAVAFKDLVMLRSTVLPLRTAVVFEGVSGGVQVGVTSAATLDLGLARHRLMAA